MDSARSRFDFLRSKPAKAVSAILALQIIVFYSVNTKEYQPSPPPLEQFSNSVGPWMMTAQYETDEYTRNLLKADDTLLRDYNSGPVHEELFVAFFKSQRAGATPHSPKMCLPANGWEEESSRIVKVSVPGEALPIPVNRYIVAKDGQRKLVLYWYENPHRVTANEYISRVYLVYDSLRYRRSDEAMVRVVTDISSSTESAQEQHAIQFIKDVYQPLRQQIWSTPTNAAAGTAKFITQ